MIDFEAANYKMIGSEGCQPLFDSHLLADPRFRQSVGIQSAVDDFCNLRLIALRVVVP